MADYSNQYAAFIKETNSQKHCLRCGRFPYCYPDSNVLRNKLNIRDGATLRRAEADISSARQTEMLLLFLKSDYLVDWSAVTVDELMQAMVDSVYDTERLKRVLEKWVTQK